MNQEEDSATTSPIYSGAKQGPGEGKERIQQRQVGRYEQGPTTYAAQQTPDRGFPLQARGSFFSNISPEEAKDHPA
ncbi:hypothetical protein TNCT_683951 [Trichonephila clavata]|uniref:Uncharacterized protein n=1 Tax=Trichonephila clavata TaxID=2740835 RepID=A0A8X6F9F5_TRICU|nr:hypothetical protein TNCT_683951 [Trichonephila clavata]